MFLCKTAIFQYISPVRLPLYQSASEDFSESFWMERLTTLEFIMRERWFFDFFNGKQLPE